MRIISSTDLAAAISMPEAIESVCTAFIELSSGRADVPVRLSIAPGTHKGATLIMPGYLESPDALATKIVSVRPDNPASGLPLIYGIVVLIDSATGQALAAIEGSTLTALRTGAASGLATELLSREDSTTLALIGAGIQAETQLKAVCAVRPIKRVFVYARNKDGVDRFIRRIGTNLVETIDLIAAQSSSEAVREADVVCTATTSSTPVFDGADLKTGTHINGVGSFTPDMQEVDLTTIRRASKIIVDSVEAAMSEAGELIIAISHGTIKKEEIYAELGDIAAGIKPGRTDREEITFFKSVGNAAQDVAVANTIYKMSVEHNLGVEVDLK